MNKTICGAAMLLIASSASAAPYDPATVGTTESTILTTRNGGNTLDIVSNSPTATVCINFGATATIAAGVCAAGEITIPPLWHRKWTAPDVPAGDVHAISSAASTPLSLRTN